jgi:hypothetical protein
MFAFALTTAFALAVTKFPSKCNRIIPPIVEKEDEEEYDDEPDDEDEHRIVEDYAAENVDYSNPNMPYGFTQIVPYETYVKGLLKRGFNQEEFVEYFLYKATYKNTKDMSSFKTDIYGFLFEIAMEEYARRHREYLLSQKMEAVKL